MTPTQTPTRVPALRNGDRLSREEFERRYYAMPHLKKAELIDGVVYLDAIVPSDGIWRTEETELDWYALRDGQYIPLKPGDDGLLRSRISPGLWLDAAALIRREVITSEIGRPG